MAALRWVRFESEALGGFACEVKELSGEEELNRLFSLAVKLAVMALPVTPALLRELLMTPAALVFEDDGAEAARIHGIVAEVAHAMAAEEGAALLSLTLVPRAWALTQTRRSELFLDRSVPQILAEKLSAAGLEEGADFLLALRGHYPPRELVAQHDESDWDFFSRLCEDLGIAFFFCERDGRDVLVLTDTSDAFEPLARLRHELSVGARTERSAAFDVVRTMRRVPARALVHDYNYRAPHHGVLASATGAADPSPRSGIPSAPARDEPSATEWVEYGVHAKTAEEAALFARVRAEALGAEQDVISAKSTDMKLRPGNTFVLIDSSGDPHRLLLTKLVRRSHGDGEADALGERTWHGELLAIPADVPYRPPRRTPRPKVAGLYHAVVDGALQGPYAELDEAGRYRVRFRRDLSGRGDLLASRPVRMLQPHAGASYGMHFPLRPGTEVLIAYVEGDPDRPMIVGAAPNAVTPSPVAQHNQTQNVLRTASSNEMVLEDSEGGERIRVHTPHARTTLQLGAPEEPEDGVLAATDASITAASSRSINEATDRRVLLCGTSVALAGDSAVLLAGVEGLLPAAQAGMHRMRSVEEQRDAIVHVLSLLADPSSEAPLNGTEDHDAVLWSDLAAHLAGRAHDAGARAIAARAGAADLDVDASLGGSRGEPIGPASGPRAIVGSAGTAALLGCDSALVLADRAAALCSQDTASVVGACLAQLKSPRRVEMAGADEVRSTSAGAVAVEAGAVCIAGGYFPEGEAKPLDEGTSVGVVARNDLRVISGEACVLVCGHKDVHATAHCGSVKLKAKEAALISAAGVCVEGGAIGLTSTGGVSVRAEGSVTVEAAGDVTVKAAGTVRIEGGTVEVAGGVMVLKGSVQRAGDLHVGGAVNGKRL